MEGKKSWFIVDGYRPPAEPDPSIKYEGHECVMILNTNSQDANVKISIYFEDRDPIEDISLIVPAKRIRAFRSNDKSVFGEHVPGISEQYSLVIRSDIGVIVQYGRLDVQQSNLAYLATLGYAE